MVTTFGRPGYLRRAMAAGASGFVVKDTPARELADAVRRVHAGLRVVDPALAAETLVTGASTLTERETEVLRAARAGGTVADLAASFPLRGHGAQLPFGRDRQDRSSHPRRGGPDRRAKRLALTTGAPLGRGAGPIGPSPSAGSGRSGIARFA